MTDPAPTKTRSAVPTTSAAARRASELSCMTEAFRGGAPNPVHWFIPGLVLFAGGLVAHAWQETR